MGNLISDISNIVVALSAACAAFAAWKGLNTWRKETEWKINYELSRDILVKMYKFREAIDNLRYPAIAPFEMEDIPQETVEQIGEEKAKYRRIAFAYKNRGKKYYEASNDFKASRLEARANWGSDLEQKLTAMDHLAEELLKNIRQYLLSINPNIEKSDRIKNRSIEFSPVIYDQLTDQDDWRDQLDKAQQSAEDHLRAKLERTRA